MSGAGWRAAFRKWSRWAPGRRSNTPVCLFSIRRRHSKASKTRHTGGCLITSRRGLSMHCTQRNGSRVSFRRRTLWRWQFSRRESGESSFEATTNCSRAQEPSMATRDDSLLQPTRRAALKTAALTVSGALIPSGLAMRQSQSAPAAKTPIFKISLAQWSFHKALFAKEMDHLDFAATARKDFGIEGVEYVNVFFKDKATDAPYLAEMKKRCDDNGVKSVLIMCDGEGALGDGDEKKRAEAVANHHKWADAAKTLGCHSIRVNAQSSGSYDEQMKRAAEGLRRLTEYCAKLDLNCIVENHGGLSSNGQWLAGVMKTVSHPRCGTLPDFGNFAQADGSEYDRYKGVTEMMPFAKAVSAKSHDFDEAGNETKTDYERMMKIVVDAGYHGFVGIEYEGERLSEHDGVLATKKLLERVRTKLSA